MESSSSGIYNISRKVVELLKEISYWIFATFQNILFTFSLDVRQLETKWEFSFCGHERKQGDEVVRKWINFLEIQHLWNLINNFVFNQPFCIAVGRFEAVSGQVKPSQELFTTIDAKRRRKFLGPKLDPPRIWQQRRGGRTPPLCGSGGGGWGMPPPLLLELFFCSHKPLGGSWGLVHHESKRGKQMMVAVIYEHARKWARTKQHRR